MANNKKPMQAGRLIAVVFIVFALAAAAEFTQVFAFLENKTYDSRLKIRANFSQPSERIVLVILDQDSLDWAKETRGWSWPWPRSAYADIIRYFAKGNAASVAFDVLYSEPSIYGTKDDAAFAHAAREYGRAIHAVHFMTEEDSAEYAAVRPIPPIADSAKLLASVRSTVDADGVVRRARLAVEHAGQAYPTLGIAPLLINTHDSTTLALTAETYGIPLRADGSMYIQYRQSIDEFIPYNARQILESLAAVEKGREPLLPPELFTDSFIFFGFYAPGLFDIAATPVSKVYPGVGVHIAMLDTILGGLFIKKAPLWITLLFTLLLTFLGAAIIHFRERHISHRAGIILSIIAAPLGFAAAVAVGVFLFITGFYLPLAMPLSAYITAFGVSVFLSYNTEGRQRRYLKTAFRHYLSPVVIEELINHPERLKLGGERREISIYFSDVQGFTSISEKLQPEELTALLNDYLSEMSAIILASGGTIDKYEGDAIIAFWNAPTPLTAHAASAVESAIRCQERLAELRDEYTRRVGLPLHMRIGLNTGAAVVGNMGSHDRFDYTMLGDAVNLAARLEGLNKQFGTYTMCTEASMEQALKHGSTLAFRELGRVAVVGKQEAVRIFEPMRPDVFAAHTQHFNLFAQGLQFFYDGALQQAFDTFTSISHADPAAKKYAEKCKSLIDSPLPSWDGVWRATTK